MAKTHASSALKQTSQTIGMFYPVLLDSHGNVIDGQHRLAANPEWPSVKLPDVESEGQRLLARLVSNVCRRSVTSKEKTQILEALGKIHLAQGVRLGELAQRIAEETGMSYTWTMKYLPDSLKVRPGLGGPLRASVHDKCKGNLDKSKVTDLVTPWVDRLLAPPHEKILTVRNFSNAKLTSVLIERDFYDRIEKAAKSLNTAPDIVLNNALVLVVEKIEKMVTQVSRVYAKQANS